MRGDRVKCSLITCRDFSVPSGDFHIATALPGLHFAIQFLPCPDAREVLSSQGRQFNLDDIQPIFLLI
jgi:hypothetical protein